MLTFAIMIFLSLGSVEGFSTKTPLSFLLGTITSVISGFLGMKIATYTNARTTLEARKGVGKAFIAAFHSGAVMGFLLAANGLLVLCIVINLFKLYSGDDWEVLLEAITGYGLGGSSMALFGRVGGGVIFWFYSSILIVFCYSAIFFVSISFIQCLNNMFVLIMLGILRVWGQICLVHFICRVILCCPCCGLNFFLWNQP
ncbi:unnamed protein product [Musa hybrid cultivar]